MTAAFPNTAPVAEPIEPARETVQAADTAAHVAAVPPPPAIMEAPPAPPVTATPAAAGGTQCEPAGPWSFTALAEYAAAGFHFVRIPRVKGKPTKGPRSDGWNIPQSPAHPNGYTPDPDQARAWIRAGDNIGLALLPSGVVSLDIDRQEETRRVLDGLGLDLGAWFADPRRVEIRSGKPGKAKLLFRVPAGAEPMPPSRKLTFGKGRESKSIFEVRHGSTDGATLQDVLPPSIHPDTLLPYELAGDVRHMPELPPELLALWRAWPEVLKTFDPAYEAPKEKPRPKSAAPMDIKGERNPVAEFNAAHDLDSVLERHGYRRKGRRWLRPGSESGIPGLTILDGKGGQPLCYSHGGDDLNDGHAHDAFDVFRILECGKDWKRALAWNPELTAHNQRLFTEKKRAERQTQAAAALALGSLYIVDAGLLCKNDGDVPSPLCNFTARIVEEVLTDDGEAQELTFAVEGRLSTGQALPRIEIPAGAFKGMAWVTGHWGVQANINAGNSNCDHLRAAIQERSMGASRRTIYAHTGWRQIDGEWRYLHAGGAMGADGNRDDIEVNPGPGNMGLYLLPDPPEGAALTEAVRASLELLTLAPQKPGFCALLLATVYRAPLGAVAIIDHATWIAGYTGAGKSEAAALALAHFGQGFAARAFPAAWVDSPGVLEVKAHAAKDAVFVIDDFKPQGSKSDVDALHGKADRIIRGVGNQAGRGRLQANMKQRATYHPRCFVLATGEDIARGQSLRARMTVAGITRNPHKPADGDIDFDRLSDLQRHAGEGTLARAMAGYVRWLAPQIDRLKATLPDEIRDIRNKAKQRGMGGHSRGPSDYASLGAGIKTLARFAVDCGALKEDEAKGFIERCGRALWDLLEEQIEHQASQDDVSRFLSLLASALSSGRCHIFDLKGSERGCSTTESGHTAPMLGWLLDGHGHFQPKGPRIGWIEGDVIYLDGDAAYSAVSDYASNQGGTIEVTQRTIFQRIYERGFLARTETLAGKLRLNVRKSIQGAVTRVYALKLCALIEYEAQE